MAEAGFLARGQTCCGLSSVHGAHTKRPHPIMPAIMASEQDSSPQGQPRKLLLFLSGGQPQWLNEWRTLISADPSCFQGPHVVIPPPVLKPRQGTGGRMHSEHFIDAFTNHYSNSMRVELLYAVYRSGYSIMLFVKGHVRSRNGI